MDNLTEKQVAELLLKKGISVEIATPFFSRLFGKKKEVIKISIPSVNKLLLITYKFLQMGIDKLDDLTAKEAYELYAQHAVAVSEIVALAVSNKKSYKSLAKRLRKSCTQAELAYLYFLVISYGGVQDFLSTIRLIKETRITKPMNLSPTEKTS